MRNVLCSMHNGDLGDAREHQSRDSGAKIQLTKARILGDSAPAAQERAFDKAFNGITGMCITGNCEFSDDDRKEWA